MAALHGDPSSAGGTGPGEPTDALRSARARRQALAEAMSRAEQALAVPSGSPTWRDEVAAALAEVRSALDEHVSEVEGEEGLLAELRQMAPRLSSQSTHLEQEHPQLCDAADAAVRTVADAPVAEVRAAVLDLLLAIARHRQRGADLVYEAYNVDIGGQ
jgi:hypothetical protein